MKNLIYTFLLLFTVTLLTTACEAEDLSNNDEQTELATGQNGVGDPDQDPDEDEENVGG